MAKKGTGGNTPDEYRFFNESSESEALQSAEELFNDHCRKARPAKESSRGHVRDWGMPHPDFWRDGRLGIRGILMAMQILWRFGSARLIKLSELSHGIPHSPDATPILRPYFSAPKNKAIYDGDYSELEETLFSHFGSKTRQFLTPKAEHSALPKRDYYVRVFRQLEATKPKDIRDVLRFLKDQDWVDGADYTPPSMAPDRQKGRHFFSKRFEEYLPPNGRFMYEQNPRKLINKANGIVALLEQESQKPVLLHGPVNAGKSGVLVEILRRLEKQSSGDDTITLRDTAGKVYPVVIINVRRNSQYEVAVTVLAALRYAKQGHTSNSNVDSYKRNIRERFPQDTPRVLRSLHSEIKDVPYPPLFFIFNSWDESGANQPRGLLRDIPNAYMVKVLYEHGHKILISTVGEPTDKKTFKGKFSPKLISEKLGDPNINQLPRYFRSLELTPRAKECAARLKAFLGPSSQLPGADLLLIAVCIQLEQLCNSIPSKCKVTEASLDAALEFYGKMREEGAEDVTMLLEYTLTCLDKLDALDLLLAIAASDDGLRFHSIGQLHKPWADAHPMVSEQEKQLLRDLSDLTNNFFLQQIPPSYVEPAHFTAYETKGKEVEVAEQEQFELNQTVRRMLIDAIFAATNGPCAAALPRLRRAFGKVSAIARRRVRNRRFQEPMACLTRDYRRLLPGVQAYEYLLASIDPIGLRDKGLCAAVRHAAPPLHCCDTLVFGDTPANDVIKLRFAALHLLREELDGPQHSLTMRYDVDETRTRLYLAALTSIGRREFREAREIELDGLPEVLPDYLQNVFTNSELLVLLEAAALSAYHSQCPDIVDWCGQQMSAIMDSAELGPGSEVLQHHATRVLCTEIDMSILLGRPNRRLLENGESHNDTLIVLQMLLVQHFPSIEDAYEEHGAGMKIEAASLNLSDWLRLKAREAELYALCRSEEASIQLYTDIFGIDLKAFPRGMGVLSGRPGRAMLKHIARWAEQQDRSDQERRKLRELCIQVIDGEASRLARFGGAERITINIARADLMKVQTGEVNDYILDIANGAREAVDVEWVSLRTRLLAVEFALEMRLEALETGLRGSSYHEGSEREAELLVKTATALRFEPQAERGKALLKRAKNFGD